MHVVLHLFLLEYLVCHRGHVVQILSLALLLPLLVVFVFLALADGLQLLPSPLRRRFLALSEVVRERAGCILDLSDQVLLVLWPSTSQAFI